MECTHVSYYVCSNRRCPVVKIYEPYPVGRGIKLAVRKAVKLLCVRPTADEVEEATESIRFMAVRWPLKEDVALTLATMIEEEEELYGAERGQVLRAAVQQHAFLIEVRLRDAFGKAARHEKKLAARRGNKRS